VSRSKTSNEAGKAGLLFVVAAPSGAGKTSLCKALMERLQKSGEAGLRWSCSYTTRKPREAELPGRDYFFIDDSTFDAMIAAGDFIEWAHIHGRRYGTSRSYLEDARRQGVDLLLEIDIQGARALREKNLGANFIFILPPSWRALTERLRGRGTEAEDEVRRRLETAKTEMLEWTWFEYIIINDDFDRAVDRLRALVLACRSRAEAMAPEVERIVAELG
jgi:guanylate kinase